MRACPNVAPSAKRPNDAAAVRRLPRLPMADASAAAQMKKDARADEQREWRWRVRMKRCWGCRSGVAPFADALLGGACVAMEGDFFFGAPTLT